MYLEFYTLFDNLHVELSNFLNVIWLFLLYSNAKTLALHWVLAKVKGRQLFWLTGKIQGLF
jgi:hypothetical protein